MGAYASKSNKKDKNQVQFIWRGVPYSCLGNFFIPMLFLWYPIHFGYKSLMFEILDGIKSTHRKASKLGTYPKGIRLWHFHKASRVNRYVNGLSRNPSSNEEDTTRAHWHGDVVLEIIPRWHVYAYLCTLLGCYRDVFQIRGDKWDSNDD